jgi:hypothetical protein
MRKLIISLAAAAITAPGHHLGRPSMAGLTAGYAQNFRIGA